MMQPCARSIPGLLLLFAGMLAAAGCRCGCPCSRSRACVEIERTVDAPMPVPTPPGPGASARRIVVDIEVFRVAGGKISFVPESIRSADGLITAVLSKANAESFHARLSAESLAGLVSAPRLLVLAGQEATITVGETLEAGAQGRTRAAPPASVGPDRDDWTGLRAAVIARPSGEGGEVTIDFSFVSRDGVAAGATPDLPSIRAGEISARVERLAVPSGGTAVLLTGLTSDTKRSRLVVLVTPRIQGPEDAAPTASPASAPPTVMPVPR